VSTTSGNTENLLEFLIPPGNLLFCYDGYIYLVNSDLRD